MLFLSIVQCILFDFQLSFYLLRGIQFSFLISFKASSISLSVSGDKGISSVLYSISLLMTESYGSLGCIFKLSNNFLFLCLPE